MVSQAKVEATPFTALAFRTRRSLSPPPTHRQPPSHHLSYTASPHPLPRRHPWQFKARHANKFLQPYSTQLELFKSIVQPGPRLVLLRSPPDTGKTSLAPSLPELFPDQKV